jgi:flagellin
LEAVPPVLSVLTNAGAIQALRARGEVVRELGQVRNRVSTGLRIASAKDEAASYIISRGMKTSVAGWGAILDSLARGQATVSVASAGVRSMSTVLMRTRERLLSLGSSDDVDSRGQLRQEIRSLIAQSDLVARQSTYRDVNLLAGAPPPPAPPPPPPIPPSPPPPPPPPPPQPADFQLPPPPTGSGDFTFTRDGGALAGVVEFEIDLGADPDVVEIYQGTKRVAATDRAMGSGGRGRPVTGVQTLRFDYDPADPQGTTLSFQFNQGARAGSPLSITALRMVYPPPPPPPLPPPPPPPPVSPSSRTVLSTPGNSTIILEAKSLLSGSLGIADLADLPLADALSRIDSALARVTSAGAYFGRLENEMERQSVFAARLQSSLEAQVARMVDADLARESARLTALQTREQLATTSLGIANASSQILLSLFESSGRRVAA